MRKYLPYLLFSIALLAFFVLLTRLYLINGNSHTVDVRYINEREIVIDNKVSELEISITDQQAVVEYLDSLGYWEQVHDHTTRQRYSPKGIAIVVVPISSNFSTTPFVVQNDQYGNPLISVGTYMDQDVQVIQVGLSDYLINNDMGSRLDTAFWQGIYMTLEFSDNPQANAQKQIDFVKSHKSQLEIFSINK